MSIFAKIRGAKKAADEHKKNTAHSTADSKSGEPSKRRYRHVPTHAALDSMNIGSAQKTPETQERIKLENRKIRALSPKRAAMIRARQRSAQPDKGEPIDTSISSIMAEYNKTPRLTADERDALRPPKISSTYSHSTFNALANTRPRYRSNGSLQQNGRSPLSLTPEPSVSGRYLSIILLDLMLI
jgi:hypothetical protein